jgi:hypothetical protein
MPELLRLPLGRGSRTERHQQMTSNGDGNGSGGEVGASGLGLWTLFAACHWDEDNRNCHINPQPGGINNPWAWEVLPEKTHRVTLATLLGPHSTLLHEIRYKAARNRAAGREGWGMILFFYDFWAGECFHVPLPLAALHHAPPSSSSSSCGQDVLGATGIVLPPVRRRGARLFAVRAVEVAALASPSSSPAHKGKGTASKVCSSKPGRRPTVFTHRASLIAQTSRASHRNTAGDYDYSSDEEGGGDDGTHLSLSLSFLSLYLPCMTRHDTTRHDTGLTTILLLFQSIVTHQ